jgi:NhaP-type Na+/H+ or K+/H+ antiporter
MGVVLANTRDLNVEELLSFKEHLTVVLISMLFILLAWIAPRGIIAAAISSLFALQLKDEVENAEMLIPLTVVRTC